MTGGGFRGGLLMAGSAGWIRRGGLGLGGGLGDGLGLGEGAGGMAKIAGIAGRMMKRGLGLGGGACEGASAGAGGAVVAAGSPGCSLTGGRGGGLACVVRRGGGRGGRGGALGACHDAEVQGEALATASGSSAELAEVQ
jgi:hypothetical protein